MRRSIASLHSLRVVLSLALFSSVALEAQASGTVLVGFTVPQAWSTGFSGQITLTNNAAWTIFDWRLTFDAPWGVSSIWDATLTSHIGTHFVIDHQNVSWDDGDLSPGETATFGFTGSGTPAVPTGAALNGTPITFNVASPAPPPLSAAVAEPWPNRVCAPYFDSTAWPPFDFVGASATTGVRHWTVAFIVATAPSNVAPSFGGYYPAAGQYLLPEINALRAMGGDVMISFGGAAGTEMAAAATSVAQLQAAYQSVIDAYGLTRIDFDVEGAWVADPPSIARRSQAIAGLQAAASQAGRPLSVWYTLPVLPSGLTADGINVLSSALTNGVVIGGVNIMAMDYGDGAAPNPNGQMGSYAIQAANSLHAQLASLYASFSQPRTAAQIWKLIGVTPMLGVNDVATEVFQPADAQQLRSFAEAHDLGLLSFWSANRDQPCAGGPQPWATSTCSSIAQTSFQFTGIFHGFTTGTWQDLGQAKAGTMGLPVLQGTGPLTPGSLASWTLSNVPANSSAVLVAGATAIYLPAGGGILVPSPDVLLPWSTGVNGTGTITVGWPAALPAGLAFYFQAGVFDAGAAGGLSASNALRLRTP